MRTSNQASTTDKNLDRLAEFLNREIEHPTLMAQIPNGAHVFHGTYSDSNLTEANLRLATNTLLGMALGYVEKAPLVMVFEYKPGQETLVDLASEAHRRKVQTLIQAFRKQSQQELNTKISELAAL
ncbi:MAG: hypothetical protein ACE5LU_24055 [Anaerolineae bacterium]